MADRIVGIIGGMGPAATVDLMQRIIDGTPASDDADHLHLMVDNNPRVPSRIAALLEGSGESPAPSLAQMARGLEAAGAELLAMPCNTAHHYLDDIAAAVRIPVIDMIDEVGRRLRDLNPSPARVGLLASTAVQRIALYERGLAPYRMQVLFPEPAQQGALMLLIRAVKAGQVSTAQQQELGRAADNLLQQGAECLVIACTELSTLAGQLDPGVPLVDAAQVLAEAVIREARREP